MKFRYFALAAAVLAAACGKTPDTTPQEVTLTTPPDPSAKTVCVDAPLVLEMSATPVLGTSGFIRVFRKDGTKVDEINLADISKTVTLEDGTMIPAGADADAGKIAIGNDYVFHTFLDALHSNQYRVVHYTPLRIKGKTLEIKLHNEVSYPEKS